MFSNNAVSFLKMNLIYMKCENENEKKYVFDYRSCLNLVANRLINFADILLIFIIYDI